MADAFSERRHYRVARTFVLLKKTEWITQKKICNPFKAKAIAKCICKMSKWIPQGHVDKRTKRSESLAFELTWSNCDPQRSVLRGQMINALSLGNVLNSFAWRIHKCGCLFSKWNTAHSLEGVRKLQIIYYHRYSTLHNFWDTLRFFHLTPCYIEITKTPSVRSVFKIKYRNFSNCWISWLAIPLF